MADLEDVYLSLENLRRDLAERWPAPDENEPAPRPRRLTKDDVLGSFLAGLHRSGGERSSVTLKSNAKGETQIEVTVRTGDTTGVETAAQAMAEASRLYTNARETFGLAGIPLAPEGGPNGGGQT